MSDAGSGDSASVSSLAGRQLGELIGAQVRLRFALQPADFAQRLLEIANADAMPAGPGWQDRIAHLRLDDLYLAWACVRGEPSAWQELARSHFEFLRTFARRYLPADAAAEVADEVIADLWERGKLERYRGRSTLRTWLAALVTNASLNAMKVLQREQGAQQAKHHFTTIADETVQRDAVADQQARDLMRGIVNQVVKELPRETKLLLQLYYEQGMTLEQMSGALRVSSAALSRRLKQTREELRSSIEVQARRMAGVPTGMLRDGIDWQRLEVDLGALLGAP